MSSSLRETLVHCPRCAATFWDWWRPSVRPLPEDRTGRRLAHASRASCPACGLLIELSDFAAWGGETGRA